MKNMCSLSDELLLRDLKALVSHEREITLNVLHHLLEVERRLLFAKEGYPSLFAYATKELGYSEGAALRRISSMRLLKSLPEIESKIESGVLPLSTLSQAQSFFKKEEIKGAKEKIIILTQLEAKSAREVEKILLSHSTEPHKHMPEKLRAVSENLHHLSLCIDQKLLDKIEELKALLSHKCAHLGMGELIEILVDESLKKHRVKSCAVNTKGLGPAKDTAPAKLAEPPKHTAPAKHAAHVKHAAPAKHGEPAKHAALVKYSAPAMHVAPPALALPQTSRYIPQALKQKVWQRDRGECTFVEQKTGRKCGSKHFLQYEMIFLEFLTESL